MSTTPSPVTPAAERWAWIVVPACGALWAALHLRDSYFFYDEWSMIRRVVQESAATGMMSSFNGHLWMLQYWLYRVQVSWFGVDSHTFICVAFVCALVALHVSLAALLRTSGLSTLLSLLLGGLLTYLGASSQNFIFVIQTSPTLSIAAAVAAAAIALARPPSPARCVAIGTLLLMAVGLDSGTAIGGVTLAVTVVVLAWRGIAALAVVPSVIALALWLVAADLGPNVPATLQVRAVFAGQLVLSALGGLIGGREIAGVFVLMLSIAAIALGLRRGYITGRSRITLVAGTLAAAVVTAGLTQSRAGLAAFNLIDFNRYLQSIAIPATLALAPAFAAIARALLARSPRLAESRAVAGIAPALVVMTFILGMVPLRPYARIFGAWNVATREGVRAAAVVIRNGCPSGVEPAPASLPLGDLAPQISTALLRELIERGALGTTSPGQSGRAVPPDPVIVSRMCAVQPIVQPAVRGSAR